MKYYEIGKSINELVTYKKRAALEEFRHAGFRFLRHLKYRVTWDKINSETVLLSRGIGGKEREQMRISNGIANEIELLQKAAELVGEANLVH